MKILALILSTLASDPNAAVERPVVAREVYRCDFETEADLDFDGWPDGWKRLRGPGLPAFVSIAIVPDGESNHALRIDLDGSGGEVTSSSIALNPQFSYVLKTRVKTAGLKQNVAWLTLSLVDGAGEVLEQHDSQ